MRQARLPAWKRLGLKLKYANENPQPNRDSSKNGAVSAHHQQDFHNEIESQPAMVKPPRKKRKTEPTPETIPPTQSKHSASSLNNGSSTEEAWEKKLKKRVSFSADTKPIAESPITSSSKNEAKNEESPGTLKKPKKKAGRKSPQPLVQKSHRALDYLNQYRTSRSSWKFNKNRETWILKHVFSETDIPREYNMALANYIHGLQGYAARERLKTQCVDMLRKDETNGIGEDRNEDSDEAFLGRFLATLENSNERKDSEMDEDHQSWAQKMSRPRMLLWSLGLNPRAFMSSDEDDEGVESSKSTKTTESENTSGINGVKPREKKRKNRTAVIEYESSNSSSSESDSESDSDSNSDSDSDNGCSYYTGSEAAVAFRNRSREDTSGSGSL
ncbi:uncharacterized protein Z518_10077 [Rhinocladiella mackenziei CBS 650.93]|uniref:WKF domain-containing protein n=1 Tax=Rhinocladiella mackenziei CBS 650.93 TaxID=1442369 RepID=A0A0D2ICR4_9EURO|nr:uncharacterized protein Z518_10077 [Rhinocladiella mackenziei CBS 650.93]KIX01011.1 hypothetical protein Z518_10077 [Rhinocladiella mackenziei CBS 650.93]